MTSSDATGLQIHDELAPITVLDVNSADFAGLENLQLFVHLTGAAPRLHNLATAAAPSSELRCDRRRFEMKIAADTNLSVPTTVAVAQDFLLPWPAPLPRNPCNEGEASP